MTKQNYQSWQIEYKCKLCEDIVVSKFANHTSRCSCGAIAVEQAPYMNCKMGKEANFLDPNAPTDYGYDYGSGEFFC